MLSWIDMSSIDFFQCYSHKKKKKNVKMSKNVKEVIWVREGGKHTSRGNISTTRPRKEEEEGINGNDSPRSIGHIS